MVERPFDPESVRTILVMRLYFVGDMLLATPVLEALKTRFPEASLAVLLKKRARVVLDGNPHVDDVLEYDGAARYHWPVWRWRLAGELRRRRFDLTVDLTGDGFCMPYRPGSGSDSTTRAAGSSSTGGFPMWRLSTS